MDKYVLKFSSEHEWEEFKEAMETRREKERELELLEKEQKAQENQVERLQKMKETKLFLFEYESILKMQEFNRDCIKEKIEQCKEFLAEQANPKKGIRALTEQQRFQIKTYISSHKHLFSMSASVVINHFMMNDQVIYFHIKNCEKTIGRWIQQERQEKIAPDQEKTDGKKVGRKPYCPPEVIREAIKFAKDLINLGSPMNTYIFRGIMIATITQGNENGEKKYPELAALYPEKFKISATWCRETLDKHYLVPRAITGTKCPPNKEEKLKVEIEDMLKRIAIISEEHSISPDAIFNWDQTGLPLISTGRTTRAFEGAKHVNVIGYGDKRMVTANPFICMNGELLSLQIIFQGKTARCKPANAEFYEHFGIRSTFSENHWSSVKTQKELLMIDLESYLKRIAQEQNRPFISMSFILIIDCYTTHIDINFVNFFKERYSGVDYPKGFLVFVPAGATGQVQPADLTVQKKIKDVFRSNSQMYVTNLFQTKKPLDLRLSVLKPVMMEWIKAVVDFFRTQDGYSLIRKGFKNAGITSSYEDPHFRKMAMLEKKRLFPTCCENEFEGTFETVETDETDAPFTQSSNSPFDIFEIEAEADDSMTPDVIDEDELHLFDLNI